MGASAKTKQNSVSTYKPTQQAADLYTNVINQATAAQSGYNPATAKTIADFSPMQQQAFQTVAGNQGAWQPGVTEGAGMVSASGQPISAADISQFFNPYQTDVINATMGQIADSDAMARRAYTGNAVAQGAIGGSGYGIGRAVLEREQGKNRNATLAGLNNQGWNTALAAAQADKARGLQAGQAAANIGQMTSNLGYQDAAQLAAAGNQQQAQQQAINDASSTNALNQQLWPMQQAQWLGSLAAGIGPLTGGTTASSGTATQSQGKGAGNMIGAGLTLAGMASDERVKENERIIGKTHDGQPIYAYNYKGDPRTQIGLMAQDVEQHHPEAVTEVGGVKHVNYDTALSDTPVGMRMADGGIASLGSGLMGWADIKPAQVRFPEPPNVSAPAQQQEGGQDFEGAFKLGEKAGAGLSSLAGKLGLGGGSAMPAASSPAGGALAASGLQGAGGGLGGIGNLLGIFGFADGGLTPTQEEMRALEMVESGGRDIVNPKSGAFGPRQLMPDTARDPGFGVRPLDQTITEPKARLAEQRRFSDDYYAAMLKRYNGDREAARIAYNGGPRRADNWLKAGRDDSVIPTESANYYKKIAGILGTGGDVIVAKATNPEVSAAAGGGEPYQSKSDRASGGMIKRLFGVDFNPLGLTEPERKAMIVAGLSMMSHGDVGRGGLAGLQYLSGVEAGERETAAAQQKLAAQMQKDAADLALRTRAVTNDETRTANEAARADRTFDYTKTKDERDAGLAERKLAADESRPTDDMREYELYRKQEIEAGRTPKGLMEYQTELKAAGRPQTNVSVSGDRKGAEEMAKLHAKTYDTLRTNAAAADGMVDQLDAIEGALKQGIQTGAAGDAIQYARKIGVALGIGNANKAAAGELADAIGNKLALMIRGGGGDSGGMPGAMSDADREFLRATVPGLTKTPEGNRQLIAIMRAVAQRNRQIHEMAVDYATTHDGQLDAGFDKAVREYVRSNPLVNALKQVQDTPRGVTTSTVTLPGKSGDFEIIGVR